MKTDTSCRARCWPPPMSWRRPPSWSCASWTGSRRRWFVAATCAAKATPGYCAATLLSTYSARIVPPFGARTQKSPQIPGKSNTARIRPQDRYSGPAMMGEMNVRVVLFAKPRELVGRPNVELALPAGATAADAWRQLSDEFHLGPLPRSFRCAVNAEYAQWEDRLTDGDELAVIPPVSGGGGGGGDRLGGLRDQRPGPRAVPAPGPGAGAGAGGALTRNGPGQTPGPAGGGPGFEGFGG